MPSLERGQVAVGKANVVQSAGRKVRLIMDLPSLSDIPHAYPLRGSVDPVGAFSLDISATHKTVRVQDSEQGLRA